MDPQTGVAQRLDLGLLLRGGDLLAHHGGGTYSACQRRKRGAGRPPALKQAAPQAGKLTIHVAQGRRQHCTAMMTDASEPPRGRLIVVRMAVHRHDVPGATRACGTQCRLIVQTQIAAKPEQHRTQAAPSSPVTRLRA